MRVGVWIRVGGGPLLDGTGTSRVGRAANAPTHGERYEHGRHCHACALPLVEQWEEVDGVLGDERPPLIDRSGEHVRVGSTTKTDLADVDRVMAALAENVADALAVHLVEQKPH